MSASAEWRKGSTSQLGLFARQSLVQESVGSECRCIFAPNVLRGMHDSCRHLQAGAFLEQVRAVMSVRDGRVLQGNSVTGESIADAAGLTVGADQQRAPFEDVVQIDGHYMARTTLRNGLNFSAHLEDQIGPREDMDEEPEQGRNGV